MPISDWRAAAAKQRPEKYAKVAKRYAPHGLEALKAARDLEDFLLSEEGIAAFELLDAANEIIPFNNTSTTGSDWESAFWLGPEGICSGSRKNPQHESAARCIFFATRKDRFQGHLDKPEEVVPYIRKLLDNLAERIENGFKKQ